MFFYSQIDVFTTMTLICQHICHPPAVHMRDLATGGMSVCPNTFATR